MLGIQAQLRRGVMLSTKWRVEFETEFVAPQKTWFQTTSPVRKLLILRERVGLIAVDRHHQTGTTFQPVDPDFVN
jgi:hypothetical protein